MGDGTAGIEEKLRRILREVLGIDAARAATIDKHTGLFGVIPELDSMAIAGLLAEIEDRFDIRIDDDEVSGPLLETFGSLVAFIYARKGA